MVQQLQRLIQNAAEHLIFFGIKKLIQGKEQFTTVYIHEILTWCTINYNHQLLKMTFFLWTPSPFLHLCILCGREAIICCSKSLGITSMHYWICWFMSGKLAGSVSCYGLQEILQQKIPLLKNWVWLTGPLAHLIFWQQTYDKSCQHPWLKTASWHWTEVIPNVLAFLPCQMHKCSSGDEDHMKYVILICWWLQLTFHSVMIVCKYKLTNSIFPCVSYFTSKSYKYFHPNLYIT